MINQYTIGNNEFLSQSVIGYFHQYYTGYKQKDNPDFLNTLKNTFNKEPLTNLKNAQNILLDILTTDISLIIKENQLLQSICIGVPRAKAINCYSEAQLMFKGAVSLATLKINSVIDGTNYITRIKNTLTTHMRTAMNVPNDGDLPYPGITVNTCIIEKGKIQNKTIILIDDIYTRNVNIDEDCIQALFDNGANRVIFYSVGYTRRWC